MQQNPLTLVLLTGLSSACGVCHRCLYVCRFILSFHISIYKNAGHFLFSSLESWYGLILVFDSYIVSGFALVILIYQFSY